MLLVDVSLTTSGPATSTSARLLRVLPPASAPAATWAAAPAACSNVSCHPQQRLQPCVLPTDAAAPHSRYSSSCRKQQRLCVPAQRLLSPHGLCRWHLLPPAAVSPARGTSAARCSVSWRSGGSCRPAAGLQLTAQRLLPLKKRLPSGTMTLAARCMGSLPATRNFVSPAAQ